MTTFRERLRRVFPLPFVAIVVLMIVLIALTPNLVSSGQPNAGNLETEAELTVDHSGNNLTHLYVKGIGTVVYASIALSIATPPNGSAPSNPSFRFGTPSYWNQSILAVETTTLDPVAVNVSVVYVDSRGVTADFDGIFEFNFTSGALIVATYLPGPVSFSSAPLSALPITYLLASPSTSGVP